MAEDENDTYTHHGSPHSVGGSEKNEGLLFPGSFALPVQMSRVGGSGTALPFYLNILVNKRMRWDIYAHRLVEIRWLSS